MGMSNGQIATLATCIIALATVAGAVIALFGIKAWRKQLEGSAHFEVARGLLLEVYRLRDALEGVRRPFMDLGEAADGDHEIPWQTAAYEKRWRPVVETEARLRVCAYEARILWGEEVIGLLGGFMEGIQSLSLVLREFADTMRDPKAKQVLSQEQRKLLYWRGHDDPFSEQLLSAVARVEAYVQPHLPRPDAHRIAASVVGRDNVSGMSSHGMPTCIAKISVRKRGAA